MQESFSAAIKQITKLLVPQTYHPRPFAKVISYIIYHIEHSFNDNLMISLNFSLWGGDYSITYCLILEHINCYHHSFVILFLKNMAIINQYNLQYDNIEHHLCAFQWMSTVVIVYSLSPSESLSSCTTWFTISIAASSCVLYMSCLLMMTFF